MPADDVEQEQALKRQELREQERKNREELCRKVFNQSVNQSISLYRTKAQSF